MFIVYHLEMLIGQDLLPISIAFGYGATLYFDGGQHEFQGNSSMVTAYAFKDRVTISHALVERLGAHEDVMHARDSLGVKIIRDARVGGIFFLGIPKECVLNLQLMGG
jgi:hypothetical protein